MSRTLTRIRIGVLVGASWLGLCVLAMPTSAGEGQSPLEWIAVPGAEGEFFLGERAVGQAFELTANECFFPGLGLRLEGEGELPDSDKKLNGGKSFAGISRWDVGDVAEWGVWFDQAGDFTVRVHMSGTNERSRYSVSCEGEISTFRAGQDREPSGVVATLRLQVKTPGRHSVLFTCKDEQNKSQSMLHSLEVTGPAALNAAVLRNRWRPAAAHTKLKSSNVPSGARLWIVEMDAVPGRLGFYSPMTTPFGYYGPTWLASGIVNTGFNFSFWSFSRGAEEPAVEQLSHLIAIGHSSAKFGGFDHEGTGVKIRGWEPLKGHQGQRQALALRVLPGDPFDTYFSYFYRTDDEAWHLFGVGKKYNAGKPLKSLKVGSFVEVPGPPHVQRTGVYRREMRYRGWIARDQDELFPLDHMRGGNVDKETGLTHTERGITDDGWFFLATGGWTYRTVKEPQAIVLPTDHSSADHLPEVPAYLRAEALAALWSLPASISGGKMSRSRSEVSVEFDIRNLGDNATVTIFWGEQEGLTFEGRWANRLEVEHPKEGRNQMKLRPVQKNEPVFVRFLLQNDEGQFWSMETLK